MAHASKALMGLQSVSQWEVIMRYVHLAFRISRPVDKIGCARRNYQIKIKIMIKVYNCCKIILSLCDYYTVSYLDA